LKVAPRKRAEELENICDYDAAKAAFEHGEDELMPAEVVYALMEGENPVQVWRVSIHLLVNQIRGRSLPRIKKAA